MGDFAAQGLEVEVGVLPERTEALVQVLHQPDDPTSADSCGGDEELGEDAMAGLPVAAVVHLEEQLGAGDDALDGQVRQVGLLDAGGAPVGMELVITVAVHH